MEFTGKEDKSYLSEVVKDSKEAGGTRYSGNVHGLAPVGTEVSGLLDHYVVEKSQEQKKVLFGVFLIAFPEREKLVRVKYTQWATEELTEEIISDIPDLYPVDTEVIFEVTTIDKTTAYLKPVEPVSPVERTAKTAGIRRRKGG